MFDISKCQKDEDGNIPEPKRSGEVWVCVLDNGCSYTVVTREGAFILAESQKSEVVAMKLWPWTEGDGLEGK